MKKESVGARVRRIRKQLGMSTHDLDRAIGSAEGYTSRLENEPRRPRADTLGRLAAALGVRAGWLASGELPVRAAAPGEERYPNRATAIAERGHRWHPKTIEHLNATEWKSEEDPPEREWVDFANHLDSYYRRGAEPGEVDREEDEDLPGRGKR